jgi:hypothetical protein
VTDAQDIQYMVKDAQGSIYGPATIPVLRQWIVEHRVLGSMHIAPQGTNDWQLVSGHPQLADLCASPAPEAPVPAAPSSASTPSAQMQAPANPYAVTTQPNYHSPMTTGSTSPLAIASMIAGIASIPLSCICIGGLAGIAAIIMGIMAMGKMKQDSNIRGRGMALAGIITGSVGILLALVGTGLFLAAALSAPHRATL